MMKLAIVAIFIASLSLANAQNGPEMCFPCNPDWVGTVHYPNFEDCNSVWKCENGVLTSMTCPAGQVFDFFLKSCTLDNPALPYTVKNLLPSGTC